MRELSKFGKAMTLRARESLDNMKNLFRKGAYEYVPKKTEKSSGYYIAKRLGGFRVLPSGTCYSVNENTGSWTRV